MREDRYPNAPGWRQGPNNQASRQTATLAKPRASALKHRVLEFLAHGPASPEELTAQFAQQGEAVLLHKVRARCTDMNKLGVLRPSGSFGRGESEKTRVIRWEIVPEGERSVSGGGR